MKTAELTGGRLDYWVAKAEGLSPRLLCGWCHVDDWSHPNERVGNSYDPHSDWELGGQIIERRKIRICYFEGTPYCDPGWSADTVHSARADNANGVFASGPTPLIAAMRAVVTSEYGDEVPDL